MVAPTITRLPPGEFNYMVALGTAFGRRNLVRGGAILAAAVSAAGNALGALQPGQAATIEALGTRSCRELPVRRAKPACSRTDDGDDGAARFHDVVRHPVHQSPVHWTRPSRFPSRSGSRSPSLAALAEQPAYPISGADCSARANWHLVRLQSGLPSLLAQLRMSVLLGSALFATLRAVSAPATGRSAGSSRPICTSTEAWSQ